MAQSILLRALLVLAVLASIFILPSNALVHHWDEKTLELIRLWRTPGLSVFFLFITQLGSTIGFLISLMGGFLYHALQRRWQTAWFFLIGIGFWKLSISFLKWWVARPRPSHGLLELTSLSMPSGHGANAVFIYGVWGLILLHKISSLPLQVFIIFLVVMMILLTDLSRLYFGVHYPSDVLMGNLWAAVGIYFLQNFKKDLFI